MIKITIELNGETLSRDYSGEGVDWNAVVESMLDTLQDTEVKF